MQEIRKILVPVDFSDHSRQALEDAIGLARIWGAGIHLLHCYQVRPEAIDVYGIAVPETLDNELRQAALRRLEGWRDKARAEGIPVEVHIEARLPADQIAATAEELGADLIVMGTRGLSGLKHVLLGSVAERTLRIAPCPVWVSRHGESH